MMNEDDIEKLAETFHKVFCESLVVSNFPWSDMNKKYRDSVIAGIRVVTLITRCLERQDKPPITNKTKEGIGGERR